MPKNRGDHTPLLSGASKPQELLMVIQLVPREGSPLSSLLKQLHSGLETCLCFLLPDSVRKFLRSQL
jgi:hypothetical protein